MTARAAVPVEVVGREPPPASAKPPVAEAKPLPRRAPFLVRWRAMARVGFKMMFHDKLKMAGTLIGVVFAVVLSNQQLATFMGLIGRNVMFLRNSGADVWIVPPGTMQVQPGKLISDYALMKARVTPEVEWAEPLLFGGASVARPDGGAEAVTLVGVRMPIKGGGPWNFVRGNAEALARPDTMIFEDVEREKLGGLNLGSVREVNGHRVAAGGFTWGLLPFGASYAFANYDLARELLKAPRDQTNFVLIKLKPGVDHEVLAKRMQSELGQNFKVVTTDQFKSNVVRFILTQTPIGMTFGSSALFGLIVGFVVVSLSMFSSVVDNLREFGTLKALGSTTGDLAKLLFVQSVLFAFLGSSIGLAVVSQIINAIRSPRLAAQLLPQAFFGTYAVMTFLCIVASSLALYRLHKLEPAMVFR